MNLLTNESDLIMDLGVNCNDSGINFQHWFQFSGLHADYVLKYVGLLIFTTYMLVCDEILYHAVETHDHVYMI